VDFDAVGASPEDRSDEYLTHPGCSSVATHYPPIEPKKSVGLDPHTDGNVRSDYI
jgi:hypothetical protein